MKNLAKMLENPFDDTTIKWARLLAFSTDNLQRMIAQNESGELATRITGTQNALTLVGQMATDDETKLGLRKARKKAKENFRKELPSRVAKLSAAITAKFGEESEQWIECFPQRRSIFTSCTDDTLKNHLAQLKNSMSEHAADLGPAVIADVTSLVTGWETVWLSSEESGAKKDASADDRQLARENLQLMLFLNLIKLMEMFPRQPEKLELYMKQSLLEAPSHEEEEEPPPPPTPPGP